MDDGHREVTVGMPIVHGHAQLSYDSTMDMQLSYDQQTIDANLIDSSNLQPLVLALDPSRTYALVRNGVRSGGARGLRAADGE